MIAIYPRTTVRNLRRQPSHQLTKRVSAVPLAEAPQKNAPCLISTTMVFSSLSTTTTTTTMMNVVKNRMRSYSTVEVGSSSFSSSLLQAVGNSVPPHTITRTRTSEARTYATRATKASAITSLDSDVLTTIGRSHQIATKSTTRTMIQPTFQHVDLKQGRSFASMVSQMKDEYGTMDDSGMTYTYPGNYVLENGQILPHAQLRYQTYGELNDSRDNVLVVCHALTGNASLHAWWGDLLGPESAFDTDKYFIVCCNILGSCYGSTSPISMNPTTGQSYGIDFPDISVQDTVRLMLLMLQQELEVSSIKCVIGGSFGGMQAIEFAVQGGSTDTTTSAPPAPYVRSVIPIACGARHTAWQIAVSEVQRQAIYKDPQWNMNPFKATHGLEVARQLGMISYRTPIGYVTKFGRQIKKKSPDSTATNPKYGSRASWQVKSYLEYQGMKFVDRFDPVTYVKMTEQMDSHDITRGRTNASSVDDDDHGTAGVADVLSRVQIPALVLGIDSDILYPLYEQEQLASYLPNGQLAIIHSDDGHDGFLLEQHQVATHIIDFLNTNE